MKTFVSTLNLPKELKDISFKVFDNQRISMQEALYLYNNASLGLLSVLSTFVRESKNGKNVYFNRNFHIEPTNICINNCRFCSYKKEKNDAQAWEMSVDEILHIVKKYKDSLATEVHIVGGVHPDRDIEYYGNLIKEVKKIMPNIVVKAFTAVEIEYMIKKANLTIEEGLKYLKDCGLESIPGGGAEIFDEKLRSEICPEKTSSNIWLEIHKQAHLMGISTNATMLYGHKETIEHRLDHINRLRELQDKAPGFSAFIPLKYKKENNQLNSCGEVSVVEDLKTYAISRIFLDNFDHIKAYRISSGLETSTLALNFGADDMDGTVDNSTKIYSMAGQKEEAIMTVEKIVDTIKNAGFTPIERDTFYNTIKIY